MTVRDRVVELLDEALEELTEAGAQVRFTESVDPIDAATVIYAVRESVASGVGEISFSDVVAVDEFMRQNR